VDASCQSPAGCPTLGEGRGEREEEGRGEGRGGEGRGKRRGGERRGEKGRRREWVMELAV
jgi:hypothetical protein